MAGSVRLEPVVTPGRIHELDLAECLPKVHAHVDNSAIELRQEKPKDMEQKFLAGNADLEPADDGDLDPPPLDPTRQSEVNVPDRASSEFHGAPARSSVFRGK